MMHGLAAANLSCDSPENLALPTVVENDAHNARRFPMCDGGDPCATHLPLEMSEMPPGWAGAVAIG